MRTVIGGILEPPFMTATAVETAGQGLDVLSSQPFDLLLTGIVLPEMSGIAFLGSVLETGQGVPVILMSGFDDDAADDRKGLSADIPFLRRRFTPDQLVQRVKEVLADCQEPLSQPGTSRFGTEL